MEILECYNSIAESLKNIDNSLKKIVSTIDHEIELKDKEQKTIVPANSIESNVDSGEKKADQAIVENAPEGKKKDNLEK